MDDTKKSPLICCDVLDCHELLRQVFLVLVLVIVNSFFYLKIANYPLQLCVFTQKFEAALFCQFIMPNFILGMYNFYEVLYSPLNHFCLHKGVLCLDIW